ncbi:MAG: ethanolamine ammonia-lyase subunit EutC [Deltaproteobacteria bacterium]|nr:ethanolamine ammonia-lyase subunit EutC [Deltaproteobacteria bacterium]
MATDAAHLEPLIAEIVRQVLAEAALAPAPAAPDDPPIRPGRVDRQVAEVLHEVFSRAPQPPFRPIPGLDRLADPAGLQALAKATPSRIGVGRAGLRYPTKTYLDLRTDHGLAREAVAAVPPAEFVRALGAVELRTKAADLDTFLLHPNLGRELDEASLQVLRNQGTRGADVQIILADGLSAWAAQKNPGLLAALQRALTAAGFSHGKPLWVHRARIAVADQIGVEMGAKATVIGLGERPGLGTGDSLSLYLAWNPKVGQDNAEKNCISNVRPAGLGVEEAARQAAEIFQKAQAIGQGGLAVSTPQRTW